MNTDDHEYNQASNEQIDALVDSAVAKLKNNPRATDATIEFGREYEQAREHDAQEKLAGIYASLLGLIDENVSKWSGEVPQNTADYFEDMELPRQLVEGILAKDFDLLMNQLKPRYIQLIQANSADYKTLSNEQIDEGFHEFMFSKLASLAALYTADKPE